MADEIEHVRRLAVEKRLAALRQSERGEDPHIVREANAYADGMILALATIEARPVLIVADEIDKMARIALVVGMGGLMAVRS
jgi:hypothetical protein